MVTRLKMELLTLKRKMVDDWSLWSRAARLPRRQASPTKWGIGERRNGGWRREKKIENRQNWTSSWEGCGNFSKVLYVYCGCGGFSSFALTTGQSLYEAHYASRSSISGGGGYAIKIQQRALNSELERHLDGSSTPVLAVVVHLALYESGSGLSLLVGETGQHSEDDRNAGLEVELHQLVGHRVADVLEVHGGALDEHTNGDHRIKRLAQCLLLVEEELRAVRQLEQAWDRLHHDVLLLDAKFLQSGHGAVN